MRQRAHKYGLFDAPPSLGAHKLRADLMPPFSLSKARPKEQMLHK